MRSRHQQTARKIFFSYRRGDNAEFVERIRDWFVQSFGRENVFMDFDTIPPFTRFSDFIRDRVMECDLLIAIIGPQWIHLLNERMADDEEDFVRTEISLALQAGKKIAPICIKGAKSPGADDLPDDMRLMLDYNVAFLDSGPNFLDNMERIMGAIENELAQDEIDSVIQIETFEFDLLGDIQNFHAAVDAENYEQALFYLRRIRDSKQAPRFFRLDEYEYEILEEIEKQKAERDYAILKMMAARVKKQLESADSVWEALQMFWETFPGYDPDELAGLLRPQPEHEIEPPVEKALLEPIADLDMSIFDQANDIDEAAFDDLFSDDAISQITDAARPEGTVSYDEAEEQGILTDEH